MIDGSEKRILHVIERRSKQETESYASSGNVTSNQQDAAAMIKWEVPFVKAINTNATLTTTLSGCIGAVQLPAKFAVSSLFICTVYGAKSFH